MGACGAKQNAADLDYDHEQNKENFKLERKQTAGPLSSTAVAAPEKKPKIDLKKTLGMGI